MRVRCIGKWHNLSLTGKEKDGNGPGYPIDYNSPDLETREEYSAAFQLEGNRFGGPFSMTVTKDDWNTFDVGEWYTLNLT